MAPLGFAAQAGACLAVVMLAAGLNGDDPFSLPAMFIGLALGLYTFKAAGLASQSMASYVEKECKRKCKWECKS